MTLNETIDIYSKDTTQDAYGTLSATRTLIDTVYAKVDAFAGGERDYGNQTEGYADYRFTILQRSDLAEADIIVWRDTDYNIKFIRDQGPLDRYMFINVERGGAM